MGEARPGKLFLTIHHLAIDGVSWRILMEDLFTAYDQLANGKSVQLPEKTTAFKHWSERLTEFARSVEIRQEREYWLKLKDVMVKPLPKDFANGEKTEAFARAEQIALDRKTTDVLLKEVPPVYGTEMNDVLLTALLLTFHRWTNESGLLLDLEGHGREDLFEDIDLSRTTGWFTTLYPVFLVYRSVSNVGELLKSVKEELRRIPKKGLGFGLLRYLNPEFSEEFSQIPGAEVSFNYLGQFDQVLPASAPFKIAQESRGLERGLENSLDHLISVNGSIVDGQLQLSWLYSAQFHRPETIKRLASGFINALNEIIAHCQSPEAGGYTPSDFSEVELDQDDIDEIMAELGE